MMVFHSPLLRLSVSTLRRFNSSPASFNQSTYHVLFYEYVPNILEKRVPYRPDHFEHAMNLVEKGHLQLGGAWGTSGDNDSSDTSNQHIDGACFVLKAMRKEEIEHFVQNDPYFVNGLVPDYQIRPWNVVVGAAMQ